MKLPEMSPEITGTDVLNTEDLDGFTPVGTIRPVSGGGIIVAPENPTRHVTLAAAPQFVTDTSGQGVPAGSGRWTVDVSDPLRVEFDPHSGEAWGLIIGDLAELAIDAASAAI